MNENQKMIVALLSAAIRNQKIEPSDEKELDWNEVYEEAKAQGVHAILYPVLQGQNVQHKISAELQQKWQRATLALSMLQLQLMKEVQNILTEFKREGIEAIGLKGILLRDLYPYPELRSMGDADLLLHKRDMEKARETLLRMGFLEGGKNPEHIEFTNKNHVDIELHWNLIGKGRFKNDVKLEKAVWDHAVKASVFGAPVLKLKEEDNFLYLGLHMAKHMIGSGFGLRQLCDFVLLYEAIKNQVDWKDFFKRIEKFGMQKFFSVLFLACEQLFSIELPDCNALKMHGSTKYSQLLLREIFSGGLFGHKDSLRTKGSFIQGKVKSSETKTGEGSFRYFKRLLFPSAAQLSARYAYAAKYPVLLPVAWLHRIKNTLFCSEFSFKQKLFFFNQYGKRSELLWWLDIR